MEVSQVINLFVTYVEKEGPFLKLWGQSEKGRSVHIEQILLGVSPQFDAGVGKVAAEVLQPGTLVCAKYKDNKYYRARILNNDFIHQDFVEVTFLDYGNKDVIPCANIRSLQNFPTSFISIPPLAIGFIFAEAHAPGGGEWNETNFQNISKEIRGREVQCHLLTQATNYYLVKILIDGTDLCNVLIQRGLMQPISLQAQQAVMLSMSLQKQQQQQAVTPALAASQNIPTNMGLNTYKACTLEPGCLYPVYVSYINDGPCHFSVQLKQSEDVLVKLMNDINNINLRMLEEVPIPGTICLSRCQEDGNICRAVVTNEVDNQFKVFYVDFGNYEVVPLDSLYQIPFKFVLPKVMAIRLSLAGVEKPTVTLEMQCAFKTFVDNRLLHMKVLPTATRMAIPKCELWDPETKTSALDVVNRAARHAYPEPIALTRGFSQQVKISYVYSCNRFYVQLANKEDELTSLMQDLQDICVTNEAMDPSSIKVGVPCCALYDEDGQWYRAQVVEVLGNTVKVRYIDFGNEEDVACTQLKEIDGEQLTVLRPQAIECSLNGYQNMDVDPERDSLLEELILEGNFTMKVVEMFDKKALVDLFDAGNYNVASLLVDRIAAAKSQVSPMLMVQAGNKLEHRKSTLSQNNGPRGDGQGFRKEGFRGDREDRQDNRGDRQDNRAERQDNRGDWQDRRGDRQDNRRERRDWNNKSNDRNEKSWRQDRQDATDFRSNERNEDTGSWRQHNNGFSVNDRLNRNKPQGDSWKTPEAVSDTNDNWDKPGTLEIIPTVQKRNNTDTQTAWNQNQTSTQDSWNNDKKEGDGFRKKHFDRNKVGRLNDRGDRFSDRGDRFNDKGDRFFGKPREGGFKKRDHNEQDSSGSEKSFQHKGGPRSSSRNDHAGFRKKFDKPYDKPRSTSHSANTDDSWNVSAVNMSIDAAPVTASYTLYEVVGSKATVSISWFHNPGHFYVQLVDFQNEFKSMMEEIQLFYKSRKPEQSVCGAPVVGLFPEDNVLYRAQVLEVIGSQYKVYYVDFGNVAIISKVWPIEKKFMNLPAQAVVCGLKRIAPSGESWPDSDTCGHYFEHESFICEFIDKDEVKTYVNLLSDQTSISDLLVQAGIAVTAQPTIPSIEVPLLLSQQFRAVIKSVNNLSDIIIALECGVAVSCAMHNLETATETFEDNLKRLLEQTVIVYVDNVIDDKLEVTLYDTEGTKLVILNPDEGAYDSVESVCPLLVLSSIIRGYVSHTHETFIYIQPAEYSETITWLLDQMFEQFENLNQENAIIPDEEQVYAVHSDDGNWYRGRVLNFDDEKVTVSFIDYGNSEDVKFEALRELDAKFKEMSILCLQVNTGEDTSIFVDKDVSATIYYGEEGWEGTVQVLESSTVESVTLAPTDDTEFVTSSAEIIKVVETEKVDQIIVEEQSSKQAIPCLKGETATLTIPREDGKIPVFVSHVDSPNEFYIQLLSSVDAIKELQRILQEQVEDMPVLENPAAGILCTAPYSVDQQWYRAEILDADDDITTVRFVDIGNTDVINNKLTQIKTLPPNLLSLAVYATKCSLNIKPKNSEWDPIAIDLFETLTAENAIADFLNQDEKINYVELHYEGQKFSDIFIHENLAIPASETSTESKLTGFVSHLNSPSEFWIQLENCIDELEWIAEQLSAAETFPELEDLAPGTLCAALFPDDQMWYRARILSNTVAGIELLFIDYGNSCTSNSLRQLPEDLVITPPLALKCSLQKPEGIPNWTQEVAQKFSDISADGQTIFTVKKLTTGETTFVQLLLDGEDIVQNLQPDTEDGYISEVENLDELKIKIGEETRQETFELERLPGMNWNEEARLKFEELNKQGNTLFQIEFVTDRVIRLYLNGADIRPDLGGDKTPSFNISQSEDDHLYLTETLASTESTTICEGTEHDIPVSETSGPLQKLVESRANESELNRKECVKVVQNDIEEHATSQLEVKSDKLIGDEHLTKNDALPKNSNQEQQKDDQMISDRPIKLQFDKASQNIQLETDKLISNKNLTDNDALPKYGAENMQNPNAELSNHNDEEQKKEIENQIISDHHVTPQLNEASQNIPIEIVLPPGDKLIDEEEQKEEINDCIKSDHPITPLIDDENLTSNNALPNDSVENLPLSLQEPNAELSYHNEEEQREEKNDRIISDHPVTPQLDEASQNIRGEIVLFLDNKLIGDENLTTNDVLPIDGVGNLQLPLQNSNAERSNHNEEEQREKKNDPMISDHFVMPQLNEVVVSLDDKLIVDENFINNNVLLKGSGSVENLQLSLQKPNVEFSNHEEQQKEEINCQIISNRPITLQFHDASQNIQVETDGTSSVKVECNKDEYLTEATKDVNDIVNKLLETEPPEILEESQHLADSDTCEQITRLTEDIKIIQIKDALTELKEIEEIEQDTNKKIDQSETEYLNKIEELQTLTETETTKINKALDKSIKTVRKGKKMIEESESKLLKELEMITNKGKTPPPSSNESSRSSSRCSLRHMRHEDRILPGYFSRPDTPITDESHAHKECSSQNKMSFDEKIVPAVLSRSHSPLSETEGSSKAEEKLC